jgi:hypothetical protein
MEGGIFIFTREIIKNGSIRIVCVPQQLVEKQKMTPAQNRSQLNVP